MSDTDAATIDALLVELQEVDYALWEEIGNIQLKGMLEADPLEEHEICDLIQGCIQRAIAAKGGDWRVESWNSPKGLFHRAEIIGWKGGEYKQDAFTSAAAILAAYVQAVRASK